MDIYDASSNTFPPWSHISPIFEEYRYYLKGEEVFPETQIDVLKILTNGGNKFPLVIVRKQPGEAEKERVEDALASHDFRSKFTESQLEMINANPNTLFQHRMWEFKYALEPQGLEVTKQREQEIRSQLLAGDNLWKQATLQELQAVSRTHQSLLTKILQS